MGKLYLHKKGEYGFTTSKHTIVADIDRLNKTYTYEDRVFNLKKPKELIITGKYRDDFSYYADIRFLPVERVIIDAKQIDMHRTTLHDLLDCKELIMTDNCTNVIIREHYGLSCIEHITIPYSIDSFEDSTVFLNKVNKITIKHKNKTCTIELDDKYKNINTTISAYNNGASLTLNVFSDKNHIKYTFYYKDDELVYEKKIIRQQITLDEKEINLIELKKLYDSKLSFKKIECKKIILNKDDLNFLTSNIDKSTIKELVIKDNNEMKLIPNDINVKLNENELITNIEGFNIDNNKLYIIEIKNNETKDFKYYFINNDLTYYVLPSLKLKRLLKFRIDKLYIDPKSYRFKLEEGWLKCMKNLTIPKIKNSKIIKKLISNSGNIYINKGEEKIKIVERDFITKKTIMYPSKDDKDFFFVKNQITEEKVIKRKALVKKYE